MDNELESSLNTTIYSISLSQARICFANMVSSLEKKVLPDTRGDAVFHQLNTVAKDIALYKQTEKLISLCLKARQHHLEIELLYKIILGWTPINLSRFVSILLLES